MIYFKSRVESKLYSNIFCKTSISQLYIIKVNNRYTIIIYIHLKGDDIMANKRTRMIMIAKTNRNNETDGITRLIQENLKAFKEEGITKLLQENLIQENLKSFESENEKQQIQLPKESSDGWTYI